MKSPRITIDNSLKKYENVNLFPEKLEKANEMLKNVGLPKTEPRNLIAAEPKVKYGKK